MAAVEATDETKSSPSSMSSMACGDKRKRAKNCPKTATIAKVINIMGVLMMPDQLSRFLVR